MSSSSNGGSNGTSHPYEARARRQTRDVEVARHQGIVKVIEVLAESAHSWEDAARNALQEAESSIRNIKSIYVKDMQAIVERGDIVRWRLNAKISFAVDHGDETSRGTEGGGRSRTETKAQGGQVMERMEEGRRHFREDRDEGRDRYESQEEGRYRGQSGYRMSEDESRRGLSEGWEQPSDYGRHQNTAWRYGGEGRQEGRFAQDRYADEGYRYQTGGYPGQNYGSREPYRQSEYLGSDQQGRSGRFGTSEHGGGQYRAGQYGGGQYGGGQFDRSQGRPGPYSVNARFAGQDTGGQFIGRQYRGGPLGNPQFGGGQYYQGSQPGYYEQGGSQFAGGRNQIGGGQYYGGGQYGIEHQGYFGEGNYRGERYGHEEGIGRQLQEFGGAMAGRVRRMFKGPKGYKRSDERIREDVCDTLSQIDEIDPSEIEVSVANGEVTLSGSVPERSMKWQAEQAVDNVSGVNDINNQLRVKRMDATSNMGSQQSASSMGSTMQSSKGSSSTRS